MYHGLKRLLSTGTVCRIKFKDALLRRDKTCRITKQISDVCEAAHIVELKDCWKHDKLGINSTGNGILLRRDLHTLFDAHYWCINPRTLFRKDKDIYGHITAKIIFNKNISIKDTDLLKYKTIDIHVDSLFYWEKRYLEFFNRTK
jgi:hypothetical protein